MGYSWWDTKIQDVQTPSVSQYIPLKSNDILFYLPPSCPSSHRRVCQGGHLRSKMTCKASGVVSDHWNSQHTWNVYGSETIHINPAFSIQKMDGKMGVSEPNLTSWYGHVGTCRDRKNYSKFCALPYPSLNLLASGRFATGHLSCGMHLTRAQKPTMSGIWLAEWGAINSWVA